MAVRGARVLNSFRGSRGWVAKFALSRSRLRFEFRMFAGGYGAPTVRERILPGNRIPQIG